MAKPNETSSSFCDCFGLFNKQDKSSHYIHMDEKYGPIPKPKAPKKSAFSNFFASKKPKGKDNSKSVREKYKL